MMNMHYHVTFMICIGMILALTGNGFAETEVNEPDRFLGGHTFVVTGSVPDPFVSTRVGSITSMGLGNLNIAADIPLPGGVVLKKGDYTLGILGIGTELQLGLTEWIALRAAVVGIVFSGINLNAVFSYGASIGYAYSGGVMVRLLRTDAFQCSLSVDLEQNSFFGIKPAQFVADSLASGELSTDRLLNQADVYLRNIDDILITSGIQCAFRIRYFW